MTFETPVAELGGVTAKSRAKLREIGISTVRDLVFHFPYRYEDFTAVVPLAGAADGSHIAVVATVAKVSNRRSFRRRMSLTEAVIDDGTGTITALWFNQPYLAKTLKTGERYRFAGKVAKTKFGLRLANPLYERAEAGGSYVRPLVPVYSAPAGLNQHALRKAIAACVPAMRTADDPLPADVRAAHGLIAFKDALIGVHCPGTIAERDAARRRLGFDELLRLQLSIGRSRRLRSARKAQPVAFDEAATRAFVASLPFALTDDQKKAAWAALLDMAKDSPMHRLLDGDVGTGKTIVAAIAMMNCARAGLQSALMAPTEILARQHYETLRRVFAGHGVTLALWTNAYKRSSDGRTETTAAKKAEAAALADEIAAGRIRVIIGTHALVEEKLRFSALALAVIDEQHRFGVRVRQTLTAKSGIPGVEPHLLSMTATPIPRSLALTVFGDLDLSLLRERPKGRKAVTTAVVAPDERGRVYAAVRDELMAGRQAFVVCPLIDPSDVLGVASVTDAFEALRKKELAGVPMGVLHGKLSAEDKESVMADFLERRIGVLVATSVVEVGVDVPNASVMCVEGAERFGLSQLHQFRGRIGRGEHAGHCYLLPSALSSGVKERLEAMVRLKDGFSLAEKDLEMRGPGDLLGVAQSGRFPALKVASLGDVALIAEAKEAAEAVLSRDPDLAHDAALRAFVVEAADKAHLE